MGILNTDFIKKFITNNQVEKLDTKGSKYIEYDSTKYRWSHGSTELSLGDGLVIYSLINFFKSKIVVCLGSGGGFIPRIMVQAHRDLKEQDLLEQDYIWDKIQVYLVDAANNIGGEVDWLDKDSYFRKKFNPRIILDTTENAYYNFFVKHDLKIDFLHIDAGHSYEDVKKDFELYSKLINKNGIITIHDTDKNYAEELIKTDKEDFTDWNGPLRFIEEIPENWQRLDLFNSSTDRDKPSSTGLTVLRRA